MLDSLYENIGRKLKGFAKFYFVFETILSIISGMVLIIFNNSTFSTGFIGLIILFLGPLFSWISSWGIYGLGEAIETSQRNSDAIYEIKKELRTYYTILEKKDITQTKPNPESAEITQKTTTSTTTAASANNYQNSSHKWRCHKCGKMREQSPCEHCGAV